MNLKNYSVGDYSPGSKIKIILWMLISSIFIDTKFPWPSKLKRIILKSFGAKIGKGLVIKPRVWIKYPWFLEIGNYTWIGRGVQIDNLCKVQIGSDVCISQDVKILTGNHNFKLKTFDLITSKININNGVWIGAYSIVLPGTIINQFAVLGAGSIIKGEIEENKIYTTNSQITIKNRY
ncbi:colanic acid biosynthesis acetyltransferase WcaF [Polaribacter sp.]|nr:colanic acid biosynthesis acetyltransferase WcaF [Polaribacter sp.]